MTLSARTIVPIALFAGFTGGCTPRTARTPAPSPTASSTMTAEEIERNASNQSIEQMLQGRFPGVIVEKAPGGGIAMRIRGTSSLYSSNEPLYVVDGSPMAAGPNGALTGLNPYDIESIQVLKNPADTAIYGMRGANGVIVIKTKGSK